MYDLVVIGGGPAGTTAAMAAAARGQNVLLLEAGRYPRHKVCGEFLSAEAAGVLRRVLGKDAESILDNALRIGEARIVLRNRVTSLRVDPPAYSVPRIVLDDCLWRLAVERGVECVCANVTEVQRLPEHFVVHCKEVSYLARCVVNAAGRWSNVSRRIPQEGSETWIGLKAHFRAELDPAVYLFFSRHGYCGVQPVGGGVVNVCALSRRGAARNIQDVLALDSRLAHFCAGWSQVTETFATAPVYALDPQPVRNGMLQAGDAAGFLHPFLGDGMSLAIRSGFLAGVTAAENPRAAGQSYAARYEKSFRQVFRTARGLERVTASTGLMSLGLFALRNHALAAWILRKTRESGAD